jgi:hypothetical protein
MDAICSVGDLLLQNPHGRSPVILYVKFTFARMLGKVCMYVVIDNRVIIYCAGVELTFRVLRIVLQGEKVETIVLHSVVSPAKYFLPLHFYT